MLSDYEGSDVDFEEIEAQLYSQVFHSSFDEETEVLPQVNAQNSINSRFKNRYYEQNSFINRPVTPRNDVFIPLTTSEKHYDPGRLGYQDSNIFDRLASRENLKVFDRLGSVLTESQGGNPYFQNKMGFAVPTGNPKKRLPKWQRKKIAKQVQQEQKLKIVRAANEDAELFRNLSLEERKMVIKYQKKQRYLERRRERKKLEKQALLIEKFNAQNKNLNEPIKQPDEPTVFTISESDSDDCVPIKTPVELIEIASDDEIKTFESKEVIDLDNLDDDVVIVEPEEKEIEIINLDLLEPELMRPPSDAASNSSIRGKERKEHNSTPESSNDFLEETPQELSLNKFNFAQHGTDFGGSKEFLKPKSLATEAFESESSCSAVSEMSTPVKAIVFKEIEFDSPSKNMFTETNLESFSKFITPRRGNIPQSHIPTLLTPNEEFQQIQTKASCHTPKSASDSSSESEYEDGKSELSAAKKSLPNLTPFDDLITDKPASTSSSDEDEENSVVLPNTLKLKPNEGAKKNKKQTNEESQINSLKRKKIKDKSQTEDIQSTPKLKKKRKSKSDTEIETDMSPRKKTKKKRKSLEGIENPSLEQEITIDITEKKKKKKPNSTGNQNEVEENQEESLLGQEKQKRKKTNSIGNENEGEEMQKESLIGQEKQKKMKATLEETNVPEEIKINEEATISPEKRKKKKNIEETEAPNEHEEVNSEISVASERRKKKKSNLEDFEIPTETTQEKNKKNKNTNTTELQNENEGDNEESATTEKRKRKKAQVEEVENQNLTEDAIDEISGGVQKRKKKQTNAEEMDTQNDDEISSESNRLEKQKKKVQQEDEEIKNDSISALTEEPRIEKRKNKKKSKETEECINIQSKKDNPGMSSSPTKKKKKNKDKTDSFPSEENNENENFSTTIEAFEETSTNQEDNIEPPASTSAGNDWKVESVLNQSDEDVILVYNQKDDFETIDLLDSDDEYGIFGAKVSEDECDWASISSSDSDYKSSLVNEEIPDDITLANLSINSVRTRFPKYWTEDMEKFYFSSWGLQNFDAEEIQKSQTDDPRMWRILERDRMHLSIPFNRGPICRKCGELGHRREICKTHPPKCSLCGKSWHQDPRCPDRMCTRCGFKDGFSTTYCRKCVYWRSYTCPICKMKGHIEKFCPDIWRRYHLTTEEGPIVEGSTKLKPKNKQWCSGCAKPGHLEYTCNYVRSHLPVLPYVIQYKDMYGFSKGTKKGESNKESGKKENTITSKGNVDAFPIEKQIDEEVNKSREVAMVQEENKTDADSSPPEERIEERRVSGNIEVESGDKVDLKNVDTISLNDNMLILFNKSRIGEKIISTNAAKFSTKIELIDTKLHIYEKNIKIKSAVLTDIYNAMPNVLRYKKLLKKLELHMEIVEKNHPNPRSLFHAATLSKNKSSKNDFMILNAVLFGKYGLEDGKRHMTILHSWLTVLRNSYCLNRHDYVTINKSLEYIFFNRRPYNFYREIISHYDKATDRFVLCDTNKTSERVAHPQTFHPQTASENPQDLLRNDILSIKVFLSYKEAMFLLNSSEGTEFIDQLRKSISIQVRLSEDSGLNCGFADLKGPKADVIQLREKIGEFLKIRKTQSQIFPVTSVQVYNQIIKSLAKVKILVYTTNISEIYSKILINQEGKTSKESEINLKCLYLKLHGLLFVQHNVLDGPKHLATLNHWKNNLHKTSDDPLPKTVLDEIKNAYFYIFDENRKDIDYNSIIKPLTLRETPPILINDIQTKEFEIRDVIKLLKNFCFSRGLNEFLKEIILFDKYLIKLKYNPLALQQAYNFIADMKKALKM